MFVGMHRLLSRYRRRGAHRTHRPGPLPYRPPADPWAQHGIVLDAYGSLPGDPR